MSNDIVDAHDLPCGHSAKYAIFGGDNGCLGCTAERIGKERDVLAAEIERLRAELAGAERDAQYYYHLVSIIRANPTAPAGELLDWFEGSKESQP